MIDGGLHTASEEFFLRSPNAYAFPSSLVLITTLSHLDSSIESRHVLIESRRVSDGVYFRFSSNQSLPSQTAFSLLASPMSPNRNLVDTYIL